MTRIMIQPITVKLAQATWETVIFAIEDQVDLLLDDLQEGGDHYDALSNLLAAWYVLADRVGLDQGTISQYRTIKQGELDKAMDRFLKTLP